MRINHVLVATSAGLLLAFPVFAQEKATNISASSEIEALKQEVQVLEQKVEGLAERQTGQSAAKQEQEPARARELDREKGAPERRQQLKETNAAPAAKTLPKISLGAGGLNVVSADTNFTMNLRGYVQLDSRTFLQNAAPGVDGFILRRVHPIISGTVFHDFDYRFVAEFGGSSPSIYDAYMNFHPWPELQLAAGRFKTPFGLEWLQPASKLSFNERSLATDLAPLRDLGVQLHGVLLNGRANYAAGIFNSVADGANTGNTDFDNNPEFIGRVFFQPLKKFGITPLEGIGFGVSGSYGSQSGAAGLTSGYKTDGQQTLFTYTGAVANGTHWRISPQGYYYWGPFNLLGEFIVSDQNVRLAAAPGTVADLQNSAWEVSAGWVLTGEKASYTGLTPRHPFNLHGGSWGAWQFVVRFAELNLDDSAFPTFANPATSASAARAWAVGFNWWLNKNVRVMTSFSRTTFTGGTAGAVTKDAEEVFFTRLQLSF